MDEIFNLPWYLIGRRGPELCPDHSELNRIHYNNGSMVYDESEPKPTLNYVEDINDVHEDKGDDDGKLLK